MTATAIEKIVSEAVDEALAKAMRKQRRDVRKMVEEMIEDFALGSAMKAVEHERPVSEAVAMRALGRKKK